MYLDSVRMAMQRVLDVEVDPEFNIYTSYHNDFFLLKTRVTVNGENTSVKAGSDEEPTLVYRSTISAKLWLIANTISPILHKFGVYHTDTFCYEQSPLFHVVFSSESCLKKFLLEMDRIKHAIQLALLSVLLESDSSRNLVVEVHPQLFLVSPNRQKMKGADLHLITAGDYSTFAARWKNSKMFDFGSLYQEVDEPPRITTHPKGLKDAVPGQTVMLTVEAIGTKPLNYKWQWKPAGEGEGSEEWQLCEMEGSDGDTLTISSVQKLNEGSYRCIVGNHAGSQTSKSAELSIAEPPKITTHPKELKDTVPGKSVSLAVHATGTEPMHYKWQWKPIGKEEGSEEWQNLSCDDIVQGTDTPTLTFSSSESCSEGHYRCVVTNCTGTEPSQCVERIIGRITDRCDLMNVLSTVSTEWYLLGIYLGIHPSKLDEFRADCKTTGECRTRMLIEWERRAVPTWPAVVKALVRIGREKLASELATKCGIPIPDKADDRPLETMEIAEVIQKEVAGSELTASICHLRDELCQIEGRLTETNQLLKTSRESQVPLNEKLNNTASKLTKLGEEVQKIAEDRDRTELELHHKQHDSQLLSEMQKDLAHSVEKCQLLREMIDDKRKEIKRLEEELKEKDYDLLLARKETHEVQKNFSKLQAELKEKHEEVKELQKEKEILCKTRREKIINITFTPTHDQEEMKQQLDTTKEELKYKSQQIEVLSSSLHEKETAISQLHSELQSYQQVSSTPQQLSEVITLTAQIGKLKQRLQEAEYQKQQVALERESAVQEFEAMQELEVQLHEHVDKPPEVTNHPQSRHEVPLGETVVFTIQATGTEPLSYLWKWKPAVREHWSDEWQPCAVDKFSGAESSMLTILSTQKSNEGSYCCAIRNYAGSRISKPAEITVANPPRNTSHPQQLACSLENTPANQQPIIEVPESVKQEMQEWININNNSVSIAVVGRAGTGKSALINSLIGFEEAPEGHTLTQETMDVRRYHLVVNGIKVTIYDTPGLQDGLDKDIDDCIRKIQKCSEVDLILFCVNMDKRRMRPEDELTIIALTKAFGEDVWKHALITLTFGNKVKPPMGGKNHEECEKYFQSKLSEWENEVKQCLVKCKVSSDIVKAIPVVPTGDPEDVTSIPDRPDWLSLFWVKCLLRCKENPKRVGFLGGAVTALRAGIARVLDWGH